MTSLLSAWATGATTTAARMSAHKSPYDRFMQKPPTLRVRLFSVCAGTPYLLHSSGQPSRLQQMKAFLLAVRIQVQVVESRIHGFALVSPLSRSVIAHDDRPVTHWPLLSRGDPQGRP